MPKSYAVRGHVTESNGNPTRYIFRQTAKSDEIKVHEADKYGELVSDPNMAAAISFEFITKELKVSSFSILLSEADIIRLVRVAMARKKK